MNYPYYGNYYQPNNQFSNYQRNYPQIATQMNMQPQQDVQQSNGISGRIVDGIDVVRTIEIPNSGVYYFPKADGSEIYVKYWTQNFTTEIATYKRIVEPVENTPTIPNAEIESLENRLTERLTDISDKLDKLVTPNNTTNRKKVANEPQA